MKKREPRRPQPRTGNRAYRKNVTVGTGSSPTTLGGSGFAGLSAICALGGAEVESDFLVDRVGFMEPLR